MAKPPTRAESIWSAIGGALVGYLLWLVAISIGDAITVVSLWSVIIAIVSVAFALWAVLRGQRLRRQHNDVLAAFVYALPVLPVLLSLGVLMRTYV